MSKYSNDASQLPAQPNDIRSPVDEIDRHILEILAVEARIPNNALADRVGIAPSTCLTRVRALVERGVIRASTPTSARRRSGTPCRRLSLSVFTWMPGT